MTWALSCTSSWDHPLRDAAESIYESVPHPAPGSVHWQFRKKPLDPLPTLFSEEDSSELCKPAALLQLLVPCALPAWRWWHQGGVTIVLQRAKAHESCRGGSGSVPPSCPTAFSITGRWLLLQAVVAGGSSLVLPLIEALPPPSKAGDLQPGTTDGR